MRITMIRLSFLLSVLFIVSCEEPASKIVHLNKQNFSTDEEKTIGRAVKEEILSLPEDIPILDKTTYSEAYNYVGTLMKTLQNTRQVTKRKDYDWDVHLIKDNKRAAFITPGGHLFIYTGLLKILNTESELVSLIAHEIYYAEGGYAVIRLKEEYPDLADLLLDNVDPPFLPDLAKNIDQITFSSKEVEKADAFAIDLLCPFQYDASGLKSILEIEESSNQKIDWLKLRPGFENRKEEIESMSKDCGEKESTFAERYQKFKSKMLPE